MSVVTHWRSAFSRGAGYEPTPIGHRLGSDVDGYYLDFGAKTTAAGAAAPEALGPAALAQLALGWWERSLQDEPDAEERFRETCDLLERAAEAEGDACVWRYSVSVPKYRLGPAWISALAQGQAASVFVRAFLRFGEERHRRLAHAAVRPLLQGTAPSVVARVDGRLALEECPTRPPSLILNGWIYALWGLRDVALALDDEPSRLAYEDSVALLLSLLARYDVGWWSRYSLYPHRLPDLAKIFYHRLHVDQLEVLGRITREPEFLEMSGRWRRYDTPAHRVRLVAQKAAFVASRYR
jgi:hypothetical protein